MSDETEVLQHIARTDLPWRTATRTRCGLDLDSLADGRVIPIDEAITKWKRLGAKRASLFMCMTCVERSNQYSVWPEFDADPVARIARECDAASRRYRRGPNVEGELFERELRAIAMLIATHRDEFDEAVAGLSEATSLADLRAKKMAAQRYGGVS